MHTQSSEIVVSGVVRGRISVAYVEDRPELDEGPFLAEERRLIDIIAREVARFVENRSNEREARKLQEQLRHADRLATIGQLAAGVAHELNEPLGGILGFTQLAMKQPGIPADVADDLRRIEAASLYARDVIRKLMIFARQSPPRKRRIKLNEIVHDCLALLGSRCESAGVSVMLLLDGSLPEIVADPSQMNQIIVNFLVNALQAMPDGGTLTIETRLEGESIAIAVSDTGAGMSPEVLDRVFDPFFTTKDVREGTGLGLAVVHGIVTAHGGRVDVQSESGKGSRFEVLLPSEGNGNEE